MSPFETLPTEILESIFLACLNISLPLTSHTLYAKLSSPHLKRQFRILSKKTEYIVYPTDGSNRTACSRTERELERVTQAGHVYSYTDSQGKMRHWLVEVNVLQREEVEGVEGVDGMKENVQAWFH